MLDNWSRRLAEQFRPMVPPRTSQIVDLLAAQPGRRFTSADLVGSLALKSEKELSGLLSHVTKAAKRAGIDQSASGSWFVCWTKSKHGHFRYYLTQERADWWNGQPDRRYWALLAKPGVYDIEAAVEELEVDWWRTGRSDLLPGDRVILWKAKGRDRHRGIVALGEVVAPKELRDDSVNRSGRRVEQAQESDRVGIRYKRCPQLPLWTGGDHGELLSSLSVSRGQGTAFIVTPAQWEAVLTASGGWCDEEPEGSRWAEWEADELVRSYLGALKAGREETGRKGEEGVRALMESLSRSRDEIIPKLGMVSSVLEQHGLPTMEVWPSQFPDDPAMERAVIRGLDSDPPHPSATAPERAQGQRSDEFEAAFVWSDDLLCAPPLKRDDREELARQSSLARPTKIDFLARQHKNQLLGEGGERWVLEYERARLHRARRPNLAKRVRWASKEDGDGLGYDIASFDEDGSPIFIEVKTTPADSRAPFIITRNEVLRSQELGPAYRLYRLFHYPERPRLFVLEGPITEHCHLEAESFRASF